MEVILPENYHEVQCGELVGQVEYSTTSGSLVVETAFGSGRYTAENSGTLDLSFKEVMDDLILFNKNGGIHLVVPKELSFDFSARAKNGAISTTFMDDLKKEEDSIVGSVGPCPKGLHPS